MAEYRNHLDAEEFSKPIFANGRYQNPWETWTDPKLSKFFKFFFQKSEANIPSVAELDVTLPVMRPDFSQFKMSPRCGVRHMWIGHASSLVQFDGITLLTDPVFSDRCSPSQWFGPKRYRPPPCTVEELPLIDCVLISHNHYDHLDYKSVISLNQRYGDNLRWYVPVGLKKWLNDSGCNNVIELSWWQEHSFSGSSCDIKFISTPCQHWCKRSVGDDNQVLWTSWCVIGPRHRFCFAGDTGYCPAFKQIGKRYGPFSLATIPIGSYSPRWFLSPQHVDPAEAVMIHSDLGSKTSIGIHWGTFALASKEFYLEPRAKIKEELIERKMEPSSFITVKHGEIIVVGGEVESSLSTKIEEKSA